MTKRECLLALSLSQSISIKQLHLFREHGKQWEEILNMDQQTMKSYGLLKKEREYEGRQALEEKKKKILERCEELDVQWITFDDKHYPKSLQQVYDAPLILYCRGTLLAFNKVFHQCVGIVGTRKSDSFINQYTKRFSQEISENGLHVVSGLAEGVDTFAHRGALLTKSPTISVLAGGVNHIYPYGNRDLYQDIIKNNGSILSEHPPDTKPYAYFFPQRNRIIAALSRAIFLPQAPLKSGAMITVMHALEQGKSIYVFTPPNNSEHFAGNLQLQESGAIMVKDVKDFLEDFFLIDEKNNEKVEASNLDEKEKVDNNDYKNKEEILLFLKRFPRTIEEIAQASGLSVREAVSMIMEMRLDDLVEELPGSRFFSL